MNNQKQLSSENVNRTHQNYPDEAQRISVTDPPSWSPNDFITEAEAYVALGNVLEDKELRQARYSGRLGFMRRKRTIFYRRDELEAFVSSILRQDYVGPCQATRTNPHPTAQPDQSLSRGQSDVTPDQFSEMLKLFEQPNSTRKK